MPTNKKIVLASRPGGDARATLENFSLVELPAPEPGPGQVLVRHDYLSLDPYMRGRMNDSKSYAAAQSLGEAMVGGTVGEVVASNNPKFAVGDKVAGMGGWQLYALDDGAQLRKIEPNGLPVQAWLGVLGMPGVTAWVGVNRIIAPKAGETLAVSAATGAVGSIVGQLAKAAGARTVGIAGGPEKCAYAVEALGFDACVDHRAENFADLLKAAAPDGIDGLFENVGGKCFDAAARRLNDFGRVALCGLVASYQGAESSSLRDLRVVLVRRLKIQGFIVFDHLDLWPKAVAELGALIAQGKLHWRESIAEGIEAAPAAFLGLLEGRNFGKQLVKLR
ncbi:NADP-dependent oxidoreductase [uncultured Rhodoblastus sp.]|uniref:NADP-dependent oxidoreductase n=1 Tax=uncultured Rhodoblastus sp. TaxID=543037 RepID=UPI0025EF256A|nr:NADP-dependent oxidoreductase [uncultured Rhodoblastus sp.]